MFKVAVAVATVVEAGLHPCDLTKLGETDANGDKVWQKCETPAREGAYCQGGEYNDDGEMHRATAGEMCEFVAKYRFHGGSMFVVDV